MFKRAMKGKHSTKKLKEKRNDGFCEEKAFNLSVRESVILLASRGAEGLTESPFLLTQQDCKGLVF